MRLMTWLVLSVKQYQGRLRGGRQVRLPRGQQARHCGAAVRAPRATVADVAAARARRGGEAAERRPQRLDLRTSETISSLEVGAQSEIGSKVCRLLKPELKTTLALRPTVFVCEIRRDVTEDDMTTHSVRKWIDTFELQALKPAPPTECQSAQTWTVP
jgi:hypothetical protein